MIFSPYGLIGWECRRITRINITYSVTTNRCCSVWKNESCVPVMMSMQIYRDVMLGAVISNPLQTAVRFPESSVNTFRAIMGDKQICCRQLLRDFPALFVCVHR